MDPTLNSGQYLIVNKLVYHSLDMNRLARYLPFIQAEPGEVTYLFHRPHRGEIIVFHYPKDPSRDFVKRVVAIPDDTIEIVRGKVYVNGEPLEEPYVVDTSRSSMEEQTLGPDDYFVLGDNRPQSNDSQDWGPVPLENIVGRAWVTYWPFSKISLF